MMGKGIHGSDYTHLPETKDNSAPIVFVDRLSKMIQIIPTKTSIDAEGCAYVL